MPHFSIFVGHGAFYHVNDINAVNGPGYFPYQAGNVRRPTCQRSTCKVVII
jgi:hypothetical protein